MPTATPAAGYRRPPTIARPSARTLERPSRRASRRPWWRRPVWLIVAVAVGYYLANLAAVVRAAKGDDPMPTQAIVVLGAAQYNGRPSNQLAARLDHAIDLYSDGVAPVVMVTGGKLEGDRYTEAEASRNYLTDRGLPGDVIIAEDRGTNTFNSLQSASKILGDHGIERVVLVTDPFHAERSTLTARELGLDASSSPTPTSVLSPWHQFRRELVEAGGISVGRIIGFGRLSVLTG